MVWVQKLSKNTHSIREGSKNQKARKYGLWPYPADHPPLTLSMVFLLSILKICTENCQINTTKTGRNKDLVLGNPLDGQRPYFRTFSFWDTSL